jgi:alkylation response protein AidB-like acyl-CoA dehydrogenase
MATVQRQPTLQPGLSAAGRRTVDHLISAADELLPSLAVGAAERERLRIMPHAPIREIADAGLLTFRVPSVYDGPGSTLAALFSFLIDLAAADSNIAQALRPCYLFVEQLRRSDVDADRRRWFPRLIAGDVFGNAGWERGGKNGEVRARITAVGDHFVANGVKSYSTGALFADWVSTMAVDDEGERVAFTLPKDRPGLHLLDDWDGCGQRLTASGTTELRDVVVYPDELRRRAGGAGRSPVTAVAQLYLAAVMAGIARNALTDGVAFAREHARPITHAGVDRTVDDPYVRHAVGEMSSRAFAAEAAVLRAAASIDEALEGPDEANGLSKASLDVARAQFFAAEAALKNAELVFEVGGASTTLREHNLDRHWRNARTVANHNPRSHKAGALGAWHLTGAELPTTGLF